MEKEMRELADKKRKIEKQMQRRANEGKKAR
jgi:hypothetical protein